MNEAEWLLCTDPETLLRFVSQSHPIRKFRLFAVACCRRIERLLLKTRLGYRGLVLAERLADGIRVTEDLSAFRDQLKLQEFAFHHIDRPEDEITREVSVLFNAAGAVHAALQSDEEFRVQNPPLIGMPGHIGGVASRASMAAAQWERMTDRHPLKMSVYRREFKNLVPLVHDIFGNPFRPVCVSSSWLAWNDGAIRKMAQVVYDDRAFDRLPLLADALEDAGCTDADILSHCRTPGEHVRGCWVVDLLLGKS